MKQQFVSYVRNLSEMKKCCNLNYKNLRYFTTCLDMTVTFCQSAGENTRKGKNDITCLADNEEKYISFTKKLVIDKITVKDGVEKGVTMDLRFPDSFRFMSSIVDKLSKNQQGDQCKNLKKCFPDENKFDLLRRNGVYLYDWVDSLETFEHPALTAKEAFYSGLNSKDSSDEYYQHAKKVGHTFKMKTFRECDDLYNNCDILILADIFENFRDVCMTNYGLAKLMV